jgi:osmotically-inducible protein OsmY
LEPAGDYPIHIIVQSGRVMLLGVVDAESDKTIAGFRAREVSGMFHVENQLVVEQNDKRSSE